MAVQRVPLPICSGLYQSSSLPFDAQNCINWIPILPEAQDAALNDHALLSAQGVSLFCDLEIPFPTRGSDQMSNIAYFVTGNYLWKINADGTSENLGYISGDGMVSMDNNGQYLVIVVPNDKAYYYNNVDNTLNMITVENNEGFRQANTVVFKDGYFIYTESLGDVFFISALNQPWVIDPLDFAAGLQPDKIVSAYINHNELYILGQDTIQIFQNVGGESFPFQKIQGALIQKGVRSIFGTVYFDNTFLFIGGGVNEKTAIWKVVGSSAAQKVSSDAIDYQLQLYTPEELASCFTMSYSDSGHFCAAFTVLSSRFEKPSLTIVFDATASALSGGKLVWHQRQSNISLRSPPCWRINNVIECYGKILCGDNIDGRIGELDPNVYTEYGDVIFRQKTSMPYANDGKYQFFGDVEITPETGVGDATGDYTNPQLSLSYSNDGGRNFISQSSRSLGEIGKYNQRCIWRRQGALSRTRMMRITCAEKVKCDILKAEAWTEGGVQ
jgi:hypothetical protein